MGRGRRFLPLAIAALALALAACGDDTSGGGGGGGDTGPSRLMSTTQAEDAARKWWSDREQAFIQRDPKALTALDAQPIAFATVEQLRASLAVNQPLLTRPRDPIAVRVHVPAQQSWPLFVLAVFDLHGDKGATIHEAEMLVKTGPQASFAALYSAALDTPEPAFDTDSDGYVRTISADAQTGALGRKASDLPSAYDAFMSALAHGATPAAAPPFAAGKYTTDQAGREAAYLRDPGGHSRGLVGSAEVSYTELNFPTPVFALKGGGGFTMFATQRNETLHPTAGQAFFQDAARHNYGADLAPGQYGQISTQTIVVVAARMPAGGAPVDVLGEGGGVYTES